MKPGDTVWAGPHFGSHLMAYEVVLVRDDHVVVSRNGRMDVFSIDFVYKSKQAVVSSILEEERKSIREIEKELRSHQARLQRLIDHRARRLEEAEKRLRAWEQNDERDLELFNGNDLLEDET